MNPILPGEGSEAGAFAAGGMQDQLLDLVGEIVWVVTADTGHVIYLNQAATSLFNLPSGQLRDRPGLWLGVVNPADKPALAELMLNAPNDQTVRHQFRVLRADGSERMLEATIRRIAAPDGGPGWIGVVARDASEIIQAQRSLTEWRSVYESLVENLPIKVFRKNRHGRLVFCNQIYCDAMGARLDDLLGKTDDDLFPPELARKYREDDQRIMESGQPYHGVEEHRLPDGQRTWVEVIKSPLRDPEGRRIGIQGVFWDVTERVEAERKLREARELAEKATRLRGEFIANVSHEIRTPMNGILGLTELLLDGRLDRTQHEYLTMIRQSADGLMTLINDILDFSKIESGKMELDVERFDLRESLADAVRALAVRAHAKQLELVADFDPELPGEVIADQMRLRQIITNLVGNAIKFTSAGQVVVRLTRLNDDIPAEVLFEVIDSGVGIPPDRIDAVFRDFEQVDVSTTRKYGGTGLGLSIARQLVSMMGGQIRVASEPGKGSRFWFRLELPVAMTTTAAGTWSEMLAGYSVLVVDDHPDSLRAITNLLRSWNMRVHQATRGAAALDLLEEQGRSSRPIDVVLADGTLPDMKISELIDRIGRLPSLALSPPPVALLAVFQPGTASGREIDLDRIHKPVTPRDLATTLQAMLGMSGISITQGAPAAARPPGESLRILLAEDNIVNQRVATAMLERLDCHVTIAGNGVDAVRLAASEPFDLILMDVQMPQQDGLDATRSIRQIPGPAANVPVIGLSAHAGQEIRLACLSAGMNDYLSKPVRREDLETLISSLRETGSTVSRATAAAAPPPDTIVDWETAMNTVGGDRNLLREIIAIFLEESPGNLRLMETAIAESDTAALRRLAHSMRGSLNYLGARAAAAIASELEQSALSSDLAPTGQIHKRLVEAVRQLTSELGRLHSR